LYFGRLKLTTRFILSAQGDSGSHWSSKSRRESEVNKFEEVLVLELFRDKLKRVL
jgi:hypothetical protein